VADKMIRRHPHIFPDESGQVESRDKSAAQQVLDWEKIKTAERGADGSALAGIAVALPAIIRAEKLQGRAARVGFDWQDAGQVLDKIYEEAGELKQALAVGDTDNAVEELGDLFFTLVNMARHLGLDSQVVLRRANDKFTKRFLAMEQDLRHRQEAISDKTLAELETLWREVKLTIND
ncbi:MAG: MazG family protein, partial [Proteobacteria bacterium]|nr:MazG family protein [Pseudomonadota bacterium]